MSQNSTEPNLIAMLYSFLIYMPIDSFTMVWFNVNKHFALIQKLGEEKSKNSDQHILILDFNFIFLGEEPILIIQQKYVYNLPGRENE